MDKRILYLSGIVAVAVIAAITQYQTCCSPSAIAKKQKLALIDSDNTKILPKWQISGSSLPANVKTQNFAFVSGSDKLAAVSTTTKTAIKGVADELAKTPFKSLEITGQYRDGQPYELGLGRAKAISTLFSNAGLDKSQIVAQAKKVATIPTKDGESVAAKLAIITDTDRLKLFKANQRLEKEEVAKFTAVVSAEKAKAAIASAENNIKQLTADNSRIEEQVSQLTIDVEQANKQLQQATAEKTSLAEKIGAVEAEKSRIAEQAQQFATDVEQANKQLQQVTAEKTSLAEKIAVVEAEKSRIAEQAQQFATDVEQANKQLQQVTAEKTSLAEKIGAVEAEKSRIAEQAQQLAADVEQANNQLQQATAEKTSLAEKIAVVEAEKLAIEKQSAASLQYSANNFSQAEDTIASLKSQLSERTSALDLAKSQVAQALKSSTPNDATKQIIATLEHKITDTLSDRYAIEEQLNKLKKSTTEKMADAESKITALNLALDQEKSALQTTEAQLADAVKSSTHASQESAAKVAALTDRLNTSETAHAAITKELADTLAAKQTLESQLADFKQASSEKLAVSERKITALNLDVEQQKSALESVQQQLEKAVATNDASVAEVTKLNEQLTAAEAANQTVKKQLDVALTEQQSLTTRLAELKQQSAEKLAVSERKITALNLDVDQQQSALDVAKSQLAEALASYTRTKQANVAKIASLTDQLTSSETAHQTITQQLNDIVSAREALAAQLADTKKNAAQALAMSDEKVKALNLELGQQKSALEDAKQQLAQTVASNDASVAEIAKLNDQLTFAEAEHQTVKKQLDVALAEQQSLTTRLAELKQQSADKLAASTGKINALNDTVNQQKSALEAAKTQIAAAIEARENAEANKVSAVAAAIAKANNDIADSIRKAPLNLYFRTNQTEIQLNNDQQQKVALIKKYLSNVEDAELLVIGHTDNIGQRDMNIQLGLKRANFAADWLAQSGIPREIMNVDSKGPDAPIAKNNTRANRALNRRVEVTIK